MYAQPTGIGIRLDVCDTQCVQVLVAKVSRQGEVNRLADLRA